MVQRLSATTELQLIHPEIEGDSWMKTLLTGNCICAAIAFEF
ncbi:hypothetical protein [Nostoc sp.]